MLQVEEQNIAACWMAEFLEAMISYRQRNEPVELLIHMDWNLLDDVRSDQA